MSVFSTILAPVIVLGVGVVVFYIADRLLPPQDKGQAETVVLVLALLFLLTGIPHIGETVHTGLPSGTAPGVDKSSWWLAFILLTGALAATLKAWGQPPQGRTGRLAALGSALTLILSADRTSVVTFGVLTDVALIYSLAYKQTEIDCLARTGFLSLLGTALLATGMALEPSFESTAVKSTATALLLLALALRLMPVPLPTWQAAACDAAARTPSSSRLIVLLLPAILTVALSQKLSGWNRLTLNDTQQTLYVFWAASILLIGALRAWGAQTPALLIDNAIFYGQAMILCVIGLGLDPAIQLAASVNAILSVLVWQLAWSQCQHLKLIVPHTWWRVLPVVLALCTQIGLPLTLGFPIRIAIYAAVFEERKWLVLLLMMASEVLYLGALLRVLLDLEGVTDSPPDQVASEVEVESSDSLPGRTVPGAWIRRLAAHTRIARRIDALLGRITHLWLSAIRGVGGKVELGYVAGAIPALALFILGLFPNLLSQERDFPGLLQWLNIPRLPVWAALLLPIVGGIVVYRQQTAILRLFRDWWPLAERLFRLDWLYRALQKISSQLRGLIWGTTLVVEGAGYMAWVVLACLVILIFVISR